MTAIKFAELLGRTSFSFLEGASRPDEMVKASKDRGLEAIGICDRDGVYGLARAHAESKRIEHRVLVGAELSIEAEGAPLQGISTPDRRIALLAIDQDGYSNLCKLLTRAHAEHEKGEAGVTIAEITALHRGLFALVPSEPFVTSDAVLGLVERDPDLAIFQVLRQEGGADVEYGVRRSVHTAIISYLVAHRLAWEADEMQSDYVFNDASSTPPMMALSISR